MQGTLILTLQKASLMESVTYLSSMAPFVKVYYRKQIFQSKTVSADGLSIQIDQQFALRFNTKIQNMITYKILHDDGGKGIVCALGQAQIAMFLKKENQNTPMCFPMVMNNKPAGELVMTATVLLDNVDFDAQGKRDKVMAEQELILQSLQKSLNENQYTVDNRKQEIAAQLNKEIDGIKKEIEQDQKEIQQNKAQIQVEEQNVERHQQGMAGLKEQEERYKQEQEKVVSAYQELKQSGFNVKYQLSNLTFSASPSVGSIDPYVILHCGGQSSKTSVKSKANHSAKWEEVLTVHSQGSHVFYVEVFDSNYTSDSFVASGTQEFVSLESVPEQLRAVRLYKEKEFVGTLMCTFTQMAL